MTFSMSKSVRSEADACEIEFVDERRVKRVMRAMKSPEATALLAETFKVLGDPTRVKIAFALSREELCVCDLVNLLGASQSAVSHCLRTLRQMKLVKYRREGKIAYYSSARSAWLAIEPTAARASAAATRPKDARSTIASALREQMCTMASHRLAVKHGLGCRLASLRR
jgi:DNA-binding transcriptional ArsR family regulator